MGLPSSSEEIRRAFIDFFVERDHEFRPSASLIPTDPTLLMTAAGMVLPFKPYFLGEEEPPWLRAVSGPEVCANDRHRHHRNHEEASQFLRNVGQLQLWRLLQGKGDSMGLRVLH